MKFRFINVGPLKEVELDLKPLTIIGGVNQVGKSFITKFLYGILSAKSSPAEEKERNDKLKRIFQQGDFRNLKNRYSGDVGLVAMDERIMFLTDPDIDDKETILRDAMESEPENVSLILVCAKLLEEKGDFKGARELVETVSKLREGDEEIAHILDDLKKLEKASTPPVSFDEGGIEEVGMPKSDESSYSQAQYNDTLEFYCNTLKEREKLLGEDHPDTATSYNNVASVYYSKGEYDKALDFYEKGLQIVRSKLGETHPNTAAFYNNIGLVYYSKGEYNKAIESYSKALKIRMDVLSYRNIAELYIGKDAHSPVSEYSGEDMETRNEFFEKEGNTEDVSLEKLRMEDIFYMDSFESSGDSKRVSYIPSPVILDIFRSILTFRGDKGWAGVSDIYWDLLKEMIGAGDPLEEVKLKDISYKIEDIIGGRLSYEMSKGFRFIRGPEEFDIDSAGSGVKLFGILQMLIERNLIIPESYIFLEEPEVHLHPSLSLKFMQVLKALIDEGVHVIVTTQSPDFIRYVEHLLNMGKLESDNCSFLSLKFDMKNRTSSGKSESTEDSLNDILRSLTEGFYEMTLAAEMEDEDMFF